MPEDLGKVLELGSLNVNGTARDVLKSSVYIGIDLQQGKDVDIQMNAHDILKNFGVAYFDVVVNMNMLEHDDRFWDTMNQVNQVLKVGGFQVFCVPTFDFPIHRYPKDYWRFGEDAVREVIFNGYEIVAYKEVFTKERDGKPINPLLCVVGKKL